MFGGGNKTLILPSGLSTGMLGMGEDGQGFAVKVAFKWMLIDVQKCDRKCIAYVAIPDPNIDLCLKHNFIQQLE